METLSGPKVTLFCPECGCSGQYDKYNVLLHKCGACGYQITKTEEQYNEKRRKQVEDENKKKKSLREAMSLSAAKRRELVILSSTIKS